MPILSFMKSNILKENSRTLMMYIFRVPLNALTIIMLLMTNILDPFAIFILISGFIFLALLASIYLLYHYYKKLAKKEPLEQPLP